MLRLILFEDIAESFSYFMLTPYKDSPQTVAESKVNFLLSV